MGTMFPHSSMFAYLHQLPSSSSPNSMSATTSNIQGVANGSSPFWGASEQEMHLQAAMGTNANSSSIMSSHITNSGLIPSSLINQIAREGQLFSQLSMETQMYFHSDGKLEEEGIVDMEKLHNWVPPTGCIPEYNEGEKEGEEGEEEEECMKRGGDERGMMRKRASSTTRMVSSSSKTPTDSQDDSSSSSISKRQRCALPIPPQQQQQEEEEEGERGNKDIMSAPLHENKTRPPPSVSRRPSKDTNRSTITRAIDDQTRDFVHVRARRGQATDSHSLAERVRREKISQRMRLLQDLVPGCNKTIGKAMMLDEIINYVQCLQNQVEFLSMKLAELSPRINFEIDGLINGEVLSNTNNNTNMFMATPYKSGSSTTNSSSSGGQVAVQGNICSMTYDPMCSSNMSFQRLLQAPPPSNGIVPPSHQSSSVPLQSYNWQGFGI